MLCFHSGLMGQMLRQGQHQLTVRLADSSEDVSSDAIHDIPHHLHSDQVQGKSSTAQCGELAN